MDRIREVRRASMAAAAAANGLSRRRYRCGSLRDSPEEDGPVELQETGRLRDRGVKKNRNGDRDRSSRSSKRRRAERLMQGSNREDGMEESSEESVNDEEEDDDDEGSGGGGAVRMLSPNRPPSISSSLLNHNHNHHRNSFPPSAATKVFRAAPACKAADEMIGVSVPRKARSASTKRLHDCWTLASGAGGEQIHRQASTSPVRQNLASTSTPLPAPVSPSSSNASVRKKMKPNGPNLRPPKSSSKSSSTNPEELEIEIAEVLYGLMTQSQGPSRKGAVGNDLGKLDLRDVNKSSGDAKSGVSSPISNSPSSAHQPSAVLPQYSGSAAPLSAIAPKRKRPRQVLHDLGSQSARRSPMNSIPTKVEMDQPPKAETLSPSVEKNPGSAAENGGVSQDFGNSPVGPPPPEPRPAKPEITSSLLELKTLKHGGEESLDVDPKDEAAAASPKNESPAIGPDNDREDVTAAKANSIMSEMESQREEKFQIDLMAPPPQMRSSPEREGGMDFATAADHKPFVELSTDEQRPVAKDKDDDKAVKNGKTEAADVAEPAEKKAKAEEGDPEKSVANRERNIDLQLDLEKLERENIAGSASVTKLHPSVQKQPPQHQHQKAARDEPKLSDKMAQSNSLPIPMSVAGWQGGLPPMGYMAPLQGVVSTDGSTVSSAPLQPQFSQPRPKRCATHCYIARNIHYFQQLNPFWPAAAGTAPIFGAKPSNLNVVPPTELHGRNVNAVQDKGQGLAIFPGNPGKDKGYQAAGIADAAQRKQQILLQQALPPGAPPSNILPGPAFIFPLCQQQAAAAAAASVRPGSMKSPASVAGVPPSNASNPAAGSGSATAAGAATALSFNYPNMAGSETQYLAILQNGYPFPIPAVGAGPTYRGTHSQVMPCFNGSFYSSQMIHPSQLQQQQQQSTPQQSSGSSSSQKQHLQGQQQRTQGNSTNGGTGSGNLISFPLASNDRPSSQPAQQQRQHQGRQLESDVGGEDSPSTAESRVTRATMGVYGPGVYGQNFTVPIHPQNFALMTPPSLLGGPSAGCSQVNKKQQRQSQQQALQGGGESLPQTFAMSFASIHGATGASTLDISSMAQNHAVLQNLPEATRHSYQIVAATTAARAAQQKKNFRISEEGKNGASDSSNMEEGKKGLMVKSVVTGGQTIAFSRPDMSDASTIPGTTVVDSSSRTTNLVSAPARTSRSVVATSTGNINTPNGQLQAHLQFQQQQVMQLQKHQQQQQLAAAAARNKTTTSNGNVYSEHLTPTSAVAAKFSNPLPGFPQNLVQSSSSGSPVQSPQWKNSSRMATPQVSSSLGSSTTSSMENLPQQQARTQRSHTQISFTASPKSSMAPQQRQQAPSNHQSQSPPVMVGSPTTSSLSKGASGSPRTTNSASASNKASQPSTLSSQQSKNSASVPSQKSPPMGGSISPSILGNPYVNYSSAASTKPQMQQQQLTKQQQMVRPQVFFSPTFMQDQAAHATGATPTSSTAGGYYLQKRRTDQQSQPAQSSSMASSSGILSLCPVTISSVNTTDAKAAAAASNMKGSGLPPQGIIHPAQFMAQSAGNPHPLIPPGFSYVQAVPSAVRVKPAEQKQPAGGK